MCIAAQMQTKAVQQNLKLKVTGAKKKYAFYLPQLTSRRRKVMAAVFDAAQATRIQQAADSLASRVCRAFW